MRCLLFFVDFPKWMVPLTFLRAVPVGTRIKATKHIKRSNFILRKNWWDWWRPGLCVAGTEVGNRMANLWMGASFVVSHVSFFSLSLSPKVSIDLKFQPPLSRTEVDLESALFLVSEARFHQRWWLLKMAKRRVQEWELGEFGRIVYAPYREQSILLCLFK